MLKKLIKLLIAIVVLLVVAAGVLWFYLDAAAKKALTEGVKYAGGVECKAESVTVSLLDGSAGIRGLAIMNPQGYRESEMFGIASADVEIQTSSLWNKPVHIRKLEIVKPVVRIETGRGGNNISVFLKHVKDTVGGAETPEKDVPTRMIVDRLVLRDATIRIGSSVAGRSVGDIKLPLVELKDIRGEGDRGVTSGELAGMIVLELVRQAAAKVPGLTLYNLIPPDIAKGVEDLRKSAQGVLNGAGGLIRNPLDSLLRPATKPSE